MHKSPLPFVESVVAEMAGAYVVRLKSDPGAFGVWGYGPEYAGGYAVFALRFADAGSSVSDVLVYPGAFSCEWKDAIHGNELAARSAMGFCVDDFYQQDGRDNQVRGYYAPLAREAFGEVICLRRIIIPADPQRGGVPQSRYVYETESGWRIRADGDAVCFGNAIQPANMFHVTDDEIADLAGYEKFLADRQGDRVRAITQSREWRDRRTPG